MLGQAEVHHLGPAVPGQHDFGTTEAVFSPDGHPIAYDSDVSGRMEVYLQAYPEPGPETRVSICGGLRPVWNPRGGELFYQGRDAIMAVRVANGTPLGAPTRLFDHARGEFLITDWNISPDGQRFLVAEKAEASSSLSQINIVTNWFEELKARVPTGKQ